MPRVVYPELARQVPDTWRIFGHSWFQYQTGPSGDQTGRVDALVRAAMDIEWGNWRNFAIAGARCMANNRENGGWARVLDNLYPPVGRSGPYAPDGGATIFCYGVNDLGTYGGQNASTRESIRDSLRAMISRARASVVWEDDNLTRHTSYTGWAASASGLDLSSGGTTRQSSAVGNTFTLTLPADYKGETVALAFLKRPGASGGTVTFTGTAGVTGTFYTGGAQNAAFFEHSYTVHRIKTLTAANAGQTIIVTASSFDASGIMFYDCAWMESLTPPPVIVCNIARLTAAGYGNALYTAWTGTEGSKDTDVTTTNTLIATMVAEFDGMVQVADMDAAIAKDAAKTSDGIHPNELGSGAIVDAILAARDRLTPPPTAFGRTLGYNPPSPRTAAQRRPRVTGHWYCPDFATLNTYTPVAGHMFAVPFQITEARDVFSQLGCEVSTAGTTTSTLRWAIYDDVNWRGYPQQKMAGLDPTSAAAFALTNSTGVKSQALQSGFGFVADPGLYWLVVKIETVGASQVLRGITGQSPFVPNRLTTGVGSAVYSGWGFTGQAAGALPGSFPVGAGPLTNTPLLQLLKSK